MLDRLKHAVMQGSLRNVDYYLAQHLAAMDSRDGAIVPLASALVSETVGAGNVCLDLNAIAGQAVLGREDGTGGITVPSLDEMVAELGTSNVVGKPGIEAPLILDEGHRLYLGRYWRYEDEVAKSLLARAVPVDPDSIDREQLKQSLKRMFSSDEGEIDWQKVAAAIAVLRRFAVISGGPGTGKTHTVTSILALLLEQSDGMPLRIAMTAPTGKAAARLTESIRLAKPHIQCSDEVRTLIPEEASTIHRLLGVRPGKAEPRHHAGNPLRVDLLVVDEASMIDLPLIARLLAALPDHARLILLGDKDQLASVEAGSVFADITGPSAGDGYSTAFIEELQEITGQALEMVPGGGGFSECVALLRKSYRFTGDKGIGPLAKAINAGKVDDTIDLLQRVQEGVQYRSVPVSDIPAQLAPKLIDTYANAFAADTPREAIEQLNGFRVLCAVRGGEAGVEQVNRVVEGVLRGQGLIQTSGSYYKGRPIMVTRNDYSLALFNGDVGILWPDPEANNDLRAWFIMPDNTMKRVLPSRLPEHETAYAMTIHKSQGSEFNEVLMLLPDDVNEVLTRELLYTGITRAKSQVEVWGNEEVIRHTVEAKVKRITGLQDKLY